MKSIITILLSMCMGMSIAQTNNAKVTPEIQTKPFVDYSYFKKLVLEVEPHREKHLVKFAKFTTMAQEENTIILDTRSREMYNKLHIKGAINLPFSDFTMTTLAKIIPSNDTRVLIYCNNNFTQKNPVFARYMATKSAPPPAKFKTTDFPNTTLALNIPTYINLFGYGYKNVYELDELLYTKNWLLQLEGTEAKKAMIYKLKP